MWGGEEGAQFPFHIFSRSSELQRSPHLSFACHPLREVRLRDNTGKPWASHFLAELLFEAGPPNETLAVTSH